MQWEPFHFIDLCEDDAVTVWIPDKGPVIFLLLLVWTRCRSFEYIGRHDIYGRPWKINQTTPKSSRAQPKFTSLNFPYWTLTDKFAFIESIKGQDYQVQCVFGAKPFKPYLQNIDRDHL